ncbi:hypothetical protein ILP97_24955 [Amycolatopsis sp. H6(2020)]|nr:hypothetical protein [Amycolatopsis sp. H6(2020)]
MFHGQETAKVFAGIEGRGRQGGRRGRVEFHRGPEPTPDSTTHYSTARFTLTATTSDDPACASAPVAQTEETVVRGVNHAAVTLYTKVPVNPGCTQVSAKVTTIYVAGNPGTAGGAAPGLPDETGEIGTTPTTPRQ